MGVAELGVEVRSGVARPALPLRQSRALAADVDVVRGERVAAALAESGQPFLRLARVLVLVPLHLLGLEGLVEALEQPELGRGTVLDADVPVGAVDALL